MKIRVLAVLHLFCLLLIQGLAFAQEAAPGAEEPTFSGMLSRMGFMFLMVFLIFHLLIIKPQRNKLKEQQLLVTNLKRGEQIITSGGLCGRFSGMEKDFILLEIAPNVKVKVEAAHIQKKLEVGSVEKAA